MLTLGRRSFASDDLLVMAIVNRTPDSFFDKGSTWADDAALERVHEVIEQGADIIDIGGVKAGPGDWVSAEEEARRIVPFVAAVRAAHPSIVISVDTWRHEIGRAACEAGADVLNDAWGGVDPALAEVAAEFGAAIVCTHAGGVEPRTRPHRIGYDDVVADVIARTTALAERAVALGVPRESVLIDPGHDFGKNTWHSLEVTRRLDELVATGWPVLVSTSNKDFVGESLGVPVDERLVGSLASVVVCAMAGASVFRVHAVRETRESLDMVACIRGRERPQRRCEDSHDHGDRMLTAAAICPPAPFLLPGLTGSADLGAEVRAACLSAIGDLVDSRPSRITVVAEAVAPGPLRADGPLGIGRYGGGVPARDRAGSVAGDPALPLPLVVGLVLLRKAGWTGDTDVLVLAPGTEPGEAAQLGRAATHGDEGLGLLLMGNGSACCSVKAPGYLHPGAARSNARLVSALVTADADTVMSLDAASSAEQLSDLRLPLQFLCGAVHDRRAAARMAFAEEFSGVFYICASVSTASPGSAEGIR